MAAVLLFVVDDWLIQMLAYYVCIFKADMHRPCFTPICFMLFCSTPLSNLYHFFNLCLVFSVQCPLADCILLHYPLNYTNPLLPMRLLCFIYVHFLGTQLSHKYGLVVQFYKPLLPIFTVLFQKHAGSVLHTR